MVFRLMILNNKQQVGWAYLPNNNNVKIILLGYKTNTILQIFAHYPKNKKHVILKD